MDKVAANSYVYAKTSGIIGKSFVGQNSSKLFSAKSLSELWTILFNSTVPALPEKLLAQEIEKEAFKRFINQYTSFIKLYDKPEEIMLDQLYIYEAENLKEVYDALCEEEKDCPELIELGEFSRLNYSAWPNIMEITAGSPFDWCNKITSVHDKQKLEFKIDIQVVKELWNAVEKTSGENRIALEKLYLNEYAIKNIVWALRLKKYYKWEKDQILENLIYVTDKPSRKDPIAAPAISILDKELDNYSHWENWKYASLLNPHIGGEVWSVEPGWIEKANRVRMNNVAMQVFHQFPMTEASLMAWFKIKNFEINCIRTAVESLRLGINSKDAMNTLGIFSE